MVRDGYAVFLKYMDIVKDNVGFMDSNRNNILVPVGSGTQVFQAGKGTCTEVSIIPDLIEIQQHPGIEVGLDFLSRVCLKGFGAFARLLQNLDLHHHGTARTTGDGVGLGPYLPIGIIKAFDDALNGVLFSSRSPPMVHIHSAFFIRVLQNSGKVHFLSRSLFPLCSQGGTWQH